MQSANLDDLSTGVFNESGGANDFRIEGNTDANLLISDASADNVGIGVAAPSSKLDVNGILKYLQQELFILVILIQQILENCYR